MQFTSQDSKVIVPSGSPVKPTKVEAQRRKNTTLTLAISLSGKSYSPQLICNTIKIPKEFMELKDNGVFVQGSYSGWQTIETFEKYLKESLLPELFLERKKLGVRSTPIIILLDGASSRRNKELLSYASIKNVIIVTLPAHTSHLIQPLDCNVNGALKNKISQYMEAEISRFIF